MAKHYEQSHPWLKFELDLKRAPYTFWLMLGECQSKIEHLAGVPLRPDTAEKLYKLYLAKGVRATTAIEGNTLSEEDVLKQIENNLTVPPSREYLKQEVENIIQACRTIAQEVISDLPELCSVERIKKFNRAVLHRLQLGDGIVPGEISTFNVTVGRYRAAPRADCQELLEKLCEWLNGKGFEPQSEIPIGMAIVKAVLAHLYLAWIHPFGDGNGRTARLLEFDILLSAGVPAPAAHLLSNHYNLTREAYYRQLDYASKSGGDIIPFLNYALQGFRDGLREQIRYIREQQRDVAFRNYVHETFRDMTGRSSDRRRHLVLDLSRKQDAVKFSDLTALSVRISREYSGTSERTLVRDLNTLRDMNLIERVAIQQKAGDVVKTVQGWRANLGLIDAFLPPRTTPKK